jgi:hypothetical protein
MKKFAIRPRTFTCDLNYVAKAGSGSVYTESDLQEQAKCFRCQGPSKPETHTNQAILVLWNGDSSFSGTFALPLCYSCSCLPHNLGLERIMPR